MNGRTFRLAALIVVVIISLFVLLLVTKPFASRLTVKAYFIDASGLRTGAPVRLAGVDVGSVKSVHPRPQVKEARVEVVMVLTTAEELKIPNDSTAILSTAGVLGETYINIDASRASGLPLQNNAVLKTVPTTEMCAQEMIEKFGQILNKNCDLEKLTRCWIKNVIARKEGRLPNLRKSSLGIHHLDLFCSKSRISNWSGRADLSSRAAAQLPRKFFCALRFATRMAFGVFARA